jgi:stage III sporulation protein AE
MFSVTQQTLGDVLQFMEALIPAYALAVTMVSGSASSIALYEMTLVLIQGCQTILLKILLPMIEGYLFLGIANYVGETDRFSYLDELLKKGASSFLKWCTGLVVGLNLIQNMILPAVDSVKSGIWQKGLLAIPGAGPIIQTVAGTLIGSGVLLKNSIGAGALIFLLLLCAVPIVKLLILTASFYLSAALLQPISDKRLVQVLNTAGESGKLFLQVLITCSTLFFITITLTTISTNLRYYTS